jgi:TadE-like protein
MLTRRGTRGQSLVEFALILPLFMLLFFGIVDGARLVYTNNQLGQAAREGVRAAVVEASAVGSTDLSCVASESLITPARPGAHVCPINEAALKADVVAAVQRMAVDLGPFSNANVFLACDSGGPGDPTATPPIPADPAPTGAWTETGANPVTYPECADPSGNLAAPNGPGSLVSVRITYQYTAITPIVSSIFGLVDLSASATMVIN